MSQCIEDTGLKTEPSSFKSQNSNQTPKVAPQVVNGKVMLVPAEEADPGPDLVQEPGGENMGRHRATPRGTGAQSRADWAWVLT